MMVELWFWAIALAILVATIAALLLPFARARSNAVSRAEHGLAVLRDQLAEIERDRAQGRLDEAEAEAATLEVKRRLLAESESSDDISASEATSSEDRRLLRWSAGGLVVAGLPIMVLATYLAVGQPYLPDRPLASRSAERAQLAEQTERNRALTDMVKQLQTKLNSNPNDADGWTLLGRSHLTLGNARDAAEAFRRAAVLSGDPQVFSLLGEALVRAENGTVSADAERAFRQVLAKRPSEPRSRYYLGVASMQRGDAQEALETWIALEADSPEGAGWLPHLRGQIERLAGETGADLAAMRSAARKGELAKTPTPTQPSAQQTDTQTASRAPRGPTAADIRAASNMNSQDRMAMIRSMVEGLEARLQDDPSDLEGWRRLGRSRGVLGDSEASAEAYRRAAELAKTNLDVQLEHARAAIPALDQTGQGADAVAKTITRIRTLAPDNPEGKFYAGILAVASGDKASAISLWESVLAVLPAGSDQHKSLEARINSLKN